MTNTPETEQDAAYLVVMPHRPTADVPQRDLRFPLYNAEVYLGSDPSCEIQLPSLESKHIRLYNFEGKWYLQDLTETLQIRQQGQIVRWFPLEFDSQTFLVGTWLCCFFTGFNSEASSYDKTIKATSETDGLTGLPLRAPFDRRLAYEIKHCNKTGQPLSVLHLDLDHFHDINEKNEHAGGDAVLREVAQRMRSHTRGREMVARYGGEEFVVLLPYTGETQAIEVAERLRRAIHDTPIAFENKQIFVTASIGCATTYMPLEPATLVAQSDRAMFRAKDMGRNCVCLYDASIDGILSLVQPHQKPE